MKNKKSYILFFSLLIIIFLMGGVALFGYFYSKIDYSSFSLKKDVSITTFNSIADFNDYYNAGKYLSSSNNLQKSVLSSTTALVDSEMALFENGLTPVTAVNESTQRISQTNVQVKNIDEPDVVKTNGQEIFFSQSANNWYLDNSKNKLAIIKALPALETSLIKNFEESGELLLKDNVLIVLSESGVVAYNVLNPLEPVKLWNLNYNSSYYFAGRLIENQLYLVTRSNLNSVEPSCPYKPLINDQSSVEISCSQIYHPSVIVPVDANYTVAKINIADGSVIKTTSFVGSFSDSIVYMSTDNIYVTFSYPGDELAFIYNFYTNTGREFISDEALAKMSKLKDYDISQQSKINELYLIIEEYLGSLSKEKRTEIEKKIESAMKNYYAEHQRDLEKTIITKISSDQLDVIATGEVAGYPLNQFSLDEYKSSLRIATTSGERVGMFLFNTSSSVNDLYVFNKDLQKTGEVLDLGKGERIYSARFIEDKGYIVTFRQTDPLYVFNLADNNNPILSGELKIPGYSSYLHPLANNVLLGIGEEDNKVKASLFDVSDPSNPLEVSKLYLDEYWSNITNSHHAFLQDEKHQIFFLPGSLGSYIVSYANNKLEIKKKIDINNAQRAVYINDYLYILSTNRVIVIDETNWEIIKDLTL